MDRRPSSPDQQLEAIGQSEAFLDLQERISLAARTDRPVIFVGERGTGKELAAARLHLLSDRWNQPYITVNCASLTPTLIESELFGHEAGSFTGATRLRKGRFEFAHGGTLFLDEVANIPMTVQEKILRVVEYGRMERVGSSSTQRVDVRLVSATNADLRAMAQAGSFRADLLDRLSFEVITLPPLRERMTDILVLARHFARRMASELGMETTPEFTDAACETLLAYPWPGNVRGLKNVVERMVYRSEGAPIDRIVFDPFDSPWTPEGRPPAATSSAAASSADTSIGNGGEDIAGNGDMGGGQDSGSRPQTTQNPAAAPTAASPAASPLASIDALPLESAVRAYEVRRLRDALRTCRFNQRRAAERLGLTYHQFRGYYRKYKTELIDDAAS